MCVIMTLVIVSFPMTVVIIAIVVALFLRANDAGDLRYEGVVEAASVSGLKRHCWSWGSLLTL